MKKTLISICLLAFAAGMVSAREQGIRPGADGKVTILQFTDTHLDPGTPARLAEGDKTFARISRMVRQENPDLLVFSGDVVTGKPARVMWQRLIDSLNVFKVPYLITFGNHDAEQDLSREEMAEIIVSSPYTLNRLAKDGQLADMDVPVYSSEGKVVSSVFCMDSHDYSTIEGIDGYGWFYPSQVSWLRERVEERTRANGGKPVPSLAFFHIALQEYVSAWRNPENSHKGRAAEDECPGQLNTGMFAAMVETGSVFGTFVGHDHDIDYIVAEKGIALGYGRFSGDETTYTSLPRGVRVIEMIPGERSFETWICEDSGRIKDQVWFRNGKITDK